MIHVRPLTLALSLALAFVVGLACGYCAGQTPARDLAAVQLDLERHVPAAAQPTTRYVSLYNLPRGQWDEAAAVVSLTLNLVSRGPIIVHPEIVPGAGGRLLRFDLAAYGLPADVWEAMVSSGEPYWHIRTQAVVDKKQPRTVYTDGGWVGLAAAADVRAKTGTGAALVRADWFVSKAITTVDNGFYYELTGVADAKTADTLYEALGIDFRATDRLNVEGWSILIRSGVTNRFRRVVRRQGAAGGAWKTEDSIDEGAEEDPLRNPLGRAHDASEHVVAKINGLPLLILFDGQGKPVDVAPQNLATDHTSAHGDGQLAPALSCLVCHREDLLRPFGNDLTSLLAGDVEAYFARAEDAAKARAVLTRDLARHLARDREDFATAVATATGGLDCETAADLSARLYRCYTFDQVTPEKARRELGLTENVTLRSVFGRSLDPILLALAEGLAVQRKQWEASFAEAALLAMGVMP